MKTLRRDQRRSTERARHFPVGKGALRWLEKSRGGVAEPRGGIQRVRLGRGNGEWIFQSGRCIPAILLSSEHAGSRAILA